MPETDKHHEEKTSILEWEAPGRPFKKRTKQFYLNGLLIMLPVEVVLFLFSQYLLMLVILALVFLAFALAYVPPKNFYYRISTEGVMIEDGFYIWHELYDFYFKKLGDENILHIRTKAFIPGELILSLGKMDEEKVKKALIPYLPFREFVKPTFMEKSGDWLSKNFPLEK